MAVRKLLNEKTGELEDIDDSLVERYINRGGYRFNPGDKVPVQSGGSAYHLLDADEAYNYIRSDNARYMNFEEYEKKRDEVDFTDFGGDMAAASLGMVEYIGTPLATAALGVAGDIGADYLNKWFDLELGSASDYITKSAEYNPWWYHGAGVAGTVGVGVALGMGGGTLAAPGVGTLAGGVAGGIAAAGKAGAQRAAVAGAAATARAAEVGRLKKLWDAIAGASKIQSTTKLGRAAEMTPVGWTMKMSNMTRNQLTKTLADGKVNAALHKINPGLAAMFKYTDKAGQLALPGLAEAGKVAFATTATAGMVTAAAEGAVFWGPTLAAKEMLLSNEDRTLGEAAGFIFEQMMMNAFVGAAFSGVLDVGLKGAVWGGQKGMDTAGKAYHWMGTNAVGQKANDWWRAGAKNFSGLDAEGQANLDYAFQSGKEGYEARQSILYMKEFYGKVVDRFKKTTNMLWVVQDFIEQVDMGGAYKPAFVNETLKEGIAAGKISGDYVPAAVDAVDTLVLLEQNLEGMLGAMSAEPGRLKADPRIASSFRDIVEKARTNIGRGVVEESRTVTQSTEADELLVQEAKDWFSSNKDRLRGAFIDQYGFIFEDPNAMARTTTGRRPKWFDEDAAEDFGEEAVAASPRGGILEEEAALASSDYIDRTGLRIIDEDEMVLAQHPDYDPETGKVLVPHEERNRLWAQLLGIRPLKEATDVNVNGQRFTYVHKTGKWMDSRGNYLQTDPEKYVWTKADLPAHRAPFDQNFIDIGGQVTQNPVQYEHYVDKKTGKVVRKWGKSREEFEDVQDKRPEHYAHAPPHLADANRHHYSQKLKDVEDEVASLQNAAKTIEEQIAATRSGAPVPMTRVGRRELLAPLAESGVPEQLQKLDDGIDVARANLQKFLRENPPAQADDFKDLPKIEAVQKATKLRAERFKRVQEATFPLKELQRQRKELELSASPDLETILEVQNPRFSEETVAKGEAMLEEAYHSSHRELDKVHQRVQEIPEEVWAAQEFWGGDVSLAHHEIASHIDGISSQADELLSSAHQYGLTNHVEDARNYNWELLSVADDIDMRSNEFIERLDFSTDSFLGKKKLMSSIRKHGQAASSRLRRLHEIIEGGVQAHDARLKSPASLQHTLNAYTKRKQAVRSELHAKQKQAAALEEQLAALPKVAPRSQGHKGAEAHSARLSKEYLAFREADRALEEHDAQVRLLWSDMGDIEQEMVRAGAIAEHAPTKEARREAQAIHKELKKKLKATNKRVSKIQTRAWRKEDKRLEGARDNAEIKLREAEKAGTLTDAPAPVHLETEGDVVRPSAARLSELSRGNITDAEKATLASFQYYPGKDKGFEAVGRRKTYGADKGAIVYDDDLVHLLETVRRSHEKGFKIKQAAPGRSPGRDIADELGPDPGRGEIGTPTPRHIDDETPARTRFVLKDEKGALVPQPKGLGYADTRFGIEGQPIDVFVEPQAPPPPPLEKFDELISEAIATGDGTELENLMRAMGFFDDMERVAKQAFDMPGTAVNMKRHEIQSYDEFWGFKPKPAQRLMPTEKRHSVRDVKDAVARIKNPEKQVVAVESQLLKDIERAMMESRASHNASEWGNELAGRLREEVEFFEFAKKEARDSGNLTYIMEIAGKYGVQVKSSEMLSDLFHAMYQLKNELHYTHSHQHVGKDGAEIFKESADLVEQFLMGAAPRPARAAFPQGRNHFGNSVEESGMTGVMGRYQQQMAKSESLRDNLQEQIGHEDPHAPSPAALRSSDEKISKWLLSTNKENVTYQMENIRAYMNKNDEILTDIAMMFDSGKFDIRNTRKMNEALEAAGLGPAKDGREAFSKIQKFVKESRSEMNGLNAQINSRKFQAQIELGVKAGGGSSWISALGPLGGLSFGAFLLHPAAAGVVAAGGITMMNPRSTAIRLAQMERMATNFHKKIQDKTNRFIYDTITGKEPTGYRQTLTRSLIGPSAPLRNQGELEEYQRKASEREVASDEFLRTREFLTDMMHNEKAMAEFIDRAVPPGLDDYAPTVRKHMQDRLRIKMMAAYETMPKTFSSQFMSTDALPSTMEMSKWARDLQAIQDPLGTLIEGLSSGSLTKAEVQMVQKTAPEVYQETVRRIVEGLSDPMIRERVPYKTKVQLTVLLGVRFTKPSTIRALQQAFQREEKKKDQQRFERVMQSTQQSAGSTVDTVERSQ